MRVLAKLTWVELKLFLREPFAIVFTFLFPLVVLVVIAGSFAINDPAFGGAKPSDYYLASYIGVVIGAIGLIALPTHFAGYAERGILRRFRASSIPTWPLLTAQMLVGLLMAIVGSLVLIVAGWLIYGASLPDSIAPLLLGFLLGAIAFLLVGLVIALITRSARAAQSIGMLLFFPMWLLSGAGPPPSVMSHGMRLVSDVLPLTFVVRALQDPWLGHKMGVFNLMLLVILAGAACLIIMKLANRAVR